jgi:hypothetical protein
MPTIDSKELIDEIIRCHGVYEMDPRAAQIVEYTNAWGGRTYGVTYCTETLQNQRRYEIETKFVRNPKVIWRYTDEADFNVVEQKGN